MTENLAGAPWLRFAQDFLRLLRPEFWLICLLPAYMGFVLGERQLLPDQARLVGLVDRMVHSGLTTQEFLAGFGGWIWDGRRFWFGMIALGPCIWGATLLFNDYWDLESDRENPRRRRSPLLLGRIRPNQALAGSILLAIVGLALALAVSWTYFVLMAGCVALSWAYSAPPLRLKERPGADVAVNAVGIGVLCGLAGWSLGAPLDAFPWVFLLQGVLLVVSLYIPSMMWDHEYDRATGARTFVVAVGPPAAYWVGLTLFVTSAVNAIALAWANYVMPRSFLRVLVPFCVLLVWEYAYLLRRWDDPARLFRGIVLFSLTLVASNLLFLLVYTGLWRL